MVGRKEGIAVRVDNCSHSLMLESYMHESTLDMWRYVVRYFFIIVGLQIHYFLVILIVSQ